MAVAGKKMLDMMKSRGGSEQEYSDEVFGTVLKTDPLQIWISSKLTISGDFLELSAAAQELKIHVSLPVKKDDNDVGTASGDVTVWRGLKAGDNVRMLRLQKGQRYLVLERI